MRLAEALIERKNIKDSIDSKGFVALGFPKYPLDVILFLFFKGRYSPPAFQEELERQGKKTIFLSLDFEYDRQYFTTQQSLLKKIELEIGKERDFVFIDEIQRKEEAGIFLKGIYDLGVPYKLIVSGSGSIDLKAKIKKSLVGRKRIYELPTISLKEFVNFRTDYRYEDKLTAFF